MQEATEGDVRGELAELLRQSDVDEVLELRSPHLGFMAFHGGRLEKATDAVASEAAEHCGASYYGIVQHTDPVTHVSSKYVDPRESKQLAAFLDHVETVITIHGYGRQRLRWSLLLGGRNRTIAAHVAGHLRKGLPQYDVLDDLDAIPRELAGQHEDNPVNRARGGGVQIELPPLLRWNQEAWGWSDCDGRPRAPQLQELIYSLANAGESWIAQAEAQ